MYTIQEGTSAQVMASIIPICFRDARTILDVTYGNGNFWKGYEFGSKPTQVNYNGRIYSLTTCDIDPEKKADWTCDFRDLSFADKSFDIVVFDPPYQTDVSKNKNSIMHKQFSSYENIEELETMFFHGVKECWSVAKLGIIVKLQDYIHGQKAVWMSDWLRDTLQQPAFDVVHLVNRSKVMAENWGEQYSMYRNHTTFWVYRKGSQYHRARHRKVTSVSG